MQRISGLNVRFGNRTGLLPRGGAEHILKKLVLRVLNAHCILGLGEGAVHPRRGLCGVAAKERVAFEDSHMNTIFKQSVRR